MSQPCEHAILPVVEPVRVKIAMKTEAFQVDVDRRLIPLLARRKREVPIKLRELAVVELLREGRLSSGKAAELLGMNRVEFFALLHHLHIPFLDHDPDQLRRDMATA